MTPPDRQPRSLVELVRDLSQQTYVLIRQELALATTTLSERAGAAMTDALWVGAGVLLLHVAAGTGVAAIVLALAAAGLPPAAGAAVMAILLGAVAAWVVRSRISTMRRRGATLSMPDDKESRQWLDDQVGEPTPSAFRSRSIAPGRG